ncbi:MAG: hypothetical protein ACLQED_00010 [Desulfobaccales bacterium]
MEALKNFNCPECGSDRTKKAKVLFESGTSTNASKMVAIKLSPPPKPGSTIGAIFMMIVSIFIFVNGIFLIATSIGGGVFFIFMGGALGIWGYLLLQKEEKKGANYKDEYAKWERLWYCERCGHAFYIQGNSGEIAT